MPFDKSAYDINYSRENITRKTIPFNRNNARDMELLAWVDREPNFASYLKDLIEKDMEESNAAQEDRGV